MSSPLLTCTPGDSPRIIAIVDTEEEFDWSKPFSREATAVRHIERIGKLQSIFDRYGVRPVYVVAYPIASQPSAFMPLRELVEEERACIGAHLHPWVTPPYSEELSKRNSYGGNLSRELEAAKLSSLTEQIRKSFGFGPTIYKAGRYGVGPNTLRILSELGYRVDLSPAPPLDCSGDGGPDFSKMSCGPFEDERTGIVVIPGTGAFQGWWRGDRALIHDWATTSWRARLHVNALLNRSRAIRRLWLSPESFSTSEMIALTKSLLGQGQRCFVVSLHSPVVLAGATPFAQSEQDVEDLLGRLADYFRFFFGELNGKAWTPEAALDHWSEQSLLRKPEPALQV